MCIRSNPSPGSSAFASAFTLVLACANTCLPRSWGPATVYIHRRLNLDGTSASSETLKDVPDDDYYDSPDEVGLITLV